MLHLSQADVVAAEEHFRAHQQLRATFYCQLRLLAQPLQVAGYIQRLGMALEQSDVHVASCVSVGQGDRADFVEHVARAWVVGVGTATEVVHDTPHRIQ